MGVQGKDRIRTLFICYYNRKRSATAERLFGRDPALDVRSAGTSDEAMVQVNEQCAATQPFDAFGRGGTCAQNGGIAGLNYRNQSFWNADWIGAHTWNSAATFVTGANSLKFGYQGAYHADNRAQEGGTNDLTYRFNNGIPNQLTQRLEAYRTYSRVRYNAFYVQDQITRGRLTMTGAVRYDHSWSYYPEQSIGGGLPPEKTAGVRLMIHFTHSVPP